jgi:release factor glutamine methyltransferase
MSTKRWIIKDLLEVTTDYLRDKKIDNPRLCAETLLAYQLNSSRIKLYLTLDHPLNEKDIDSYRSMIKRRVDREPAQYITGVQEFWSLEFLVGPQALIPRPETEILVEQVLSILKDDKSNKEQGPSILDLGTGSGAIAVSLAKELQGATIWASDISALALDLARINSEKHAVNSRIHLVQGDLFEPFSGEPLKFDIIVSNPPYIPSEDYDSLPPEVKDYEPRLALNGHEGGFFFIEKIIMEAPVYLNPGGWLLIEMDPGQTLKAFNMIEQNHSYREHRCAKDYSQKDRVVIARKIS